VTLAGSLGLVSMRQSSRGAFGPLLRAMNRDDRPCLRTPGARRAPGVARSPDSLWFMEKNLPRRVEKPWGYEIWWAHTDHYAGKILHVNAGHRLSLQYHVHKDESCYLLSGKLLLVQGDSAEDLTETVISEGHAWRNKPGLVHTIEAIEDADVLEASTPQLDDVVRLADAYGRQGTSTP